MFVLYKITQVVDQSERTCSRFARLSDHETRRRRINAIGATLDDCLLEELQSRLERNLLKRRRGRFDAFAVQRFERSVERHVVGYEREMSRVDCDSINFEDILHFLHHDSCCSFDAISVGDSMDVVRVKPVQVEDLVELKHGL